MSEFSHQHNSVYDDEHEHDENLKIIPNSLHNFALNRVLEVMGIITILLVIFTAIAVMSWSPSDPSLNHATSDIAQNTLGLTGAYLSDFLIQTFGFAVVFLMIPIVIMGWGLARYHMLQRPILRLIAWIVAGVFIAGALSVLPNWFGWPLDIGFGGISGKVTNSIVADIFGSSSSVTAQTLSAILLGFIGLALGLYACGLRFKEMLATFTFLNESSIDTGINLAIRAKQTTGHLGRKSMSAATFLSNLKYKNAEPFDPEKKPWKIADHKKPVIYRDLSQKSHAIDHVGHENNNVEQNIHSDENNMKNAPEFLSQKKQNSTDDRTREYSPLRAKTSQFFNKIMSGMGVAAQNQAQHIEPEFNPYAFEPLNREAAHADKMHIPELHQEVKQHYQTLNTENQTGQHNKYHIVNEPQIMQTSFDNSTNINTDAEVVGSADMGDFYDGPNSYDDYWTDATLVQNFEPTSNDGPQYAPAPTPTPTSQFTPAPQSEQHEAHPFAPEQGSNAHFNAPKYQNGSAHLNVPTQHDAFEPSGLISDAQFYGQETQSSFNSHELFNTHLPVNVAPQQQQFSQPEQYDVPEQFCAPDLQTNFAPALLNVPAAAPPLQVNQEFQSHNEFQGHNEYLPTAHPAFDVHNANVQSPNAYMPAPIAQPAPTAQPAPIHAEPIQQAAPAQATTSLAAEVTPVVAEVALEPLQNPFATKAANSNSVAQTSGNTAPFDLSAPQVNVRKGLTVANGPAFDNGGFNLPSTDLLALPIVEDGHEGIPEKVLAANARILENVLAEFRISGEIMNVRPGPVVTLYELEPAPGVKSARVIGLADDIARSMSAISARIAVIPGRNVIGIELPNEHRDMVFLSEIITSEEFANDKLKLPIALGKSIDGTPVVADLARMPHVLIAGTTGSGKSVGINSMILSILYKHSPDKCKLIMVDPKMLELSIYDGIPHLLTPVVTDPKKAVVALKWSVREMENRYKKMSKMGVRNIEGYNQRIKAAEDKGEPLMRTVQTGFDHETGKPVYEHEALDYKEMPFIVIVIDEMADLMMVAGKEIESAVQRLAQMARAAGIHIITATQRPSVDVITGSIKANFPTRISFQVTSKIDSRTILNEMGAEQLLGQGDMLHMAGGGRISRVHGAFVSDEEVESIVNHLKRQGVPEYIDDITTDVDPEGETAAADGGPAPTTGENGEALELYDQAVAIVARDKKASTSYIQRKLSIGYNRAATIIERMEEEGVVSPANHAGKREILVGDASTL